jgi:hypothetical protein
VRNSQESQFVLIAAGAVLAYLFLKGQGSESIPAEVIALDESPLTDWAEAETGLSL